MRIFEGEVSHEGVVIVGDMTVGWSSIVSPETVIQMLLSVLPMVRLFRWTPLTAS